MLLKIAHAFDLHARLPQQFAARYAFESRYSQFDGYDPILSDIKFTQGQELPTALQLKFCPANLLTHYGGAILKRHSKLHRIEVQRDIEARVLHLGDLNARPVMVEGPLH